MAKESMEAFCLGTGCMVKCDTCQWEANWQTLNELPDTLRRAMQKKMISISTDACQITSGRYYKARTEPESGHE